MATENKTKNIYDQVVQNVRNAAAANLKLQRELVDGWTRLWPGAAGPPLDWLTPVRRFQEHWTDSMLNLARNQWDVLDRQMDAMVDSMDSVWGATRKQLAAPQPPQPAAPPPAPSAPSAKPVAATPPPAPAEASQPAVQQTGQDELTGTKNIAQKVAVVTGAASGIGGAVARELAKRGARAVMMVDRSDAVHELANSINQEFDRSVAAALVGDAADPEFRARVYDQAAADHGIVSICVPAAGITRDALSVRIDKETGKASIYSVDDFRQVTEVNLIAPIYWAIEMVARIAEDRRRRGLKRWEPEEGIEGAVVFLGSVSSQGNKGQISYAVAKAGLEGAAATLMKEAIFHGVRCGIIHPGFTDTPMARALGEEFLQKYVLPFTQLRRLILPEEIADAICFMVSNSAVSGELWADAGWHPPA